MAPARRRGLWRRGALIALAPLLCAAASGCGSYHALVRTEGAPLYADPQRRAVIARLDKLDRLDLGITLPDEDPIPVEHGGRRGYADQDDLWIFHRADGERLEPLVEAHRRELVLAEKPWPARTKAAIRARELLPGMTREMATLAWGMPREVVRADDGSETWAFEEVRWEVRSVRYRSIGPDVRIGIGFGGYWGRCGPGIGYGGFGMTFPVYTDTLEHTAIPRTELRRVRFVDGVVASGDAGAAEWLADPGLDPGLDPAEPGR
jgi:hypothetical protein